MRRIIRHSVSAVTLTGHKKEKQLAREQLAVEGYDPGVTIAGAGEWLADGIYPVNALDRKIKHGDDLSFEEAFSGMCYVVAATNNLFYWAHRDALSEPYGRSLTQESMLAIGTAFLQLMAAKESFSLLTPDEVAGLVAATMNDVLVRLPLSRIVETCGMGGDKGFIQPSGPRKKSINVSTLSSFVLSACGLPTLKHGSYKNTSAVGSTEAIEHFGARTSFTSSEEILAIWRDHQYCYLDAHLVKTVHDLSHLLMMETVNHIIGPMSLPVHAGTRIVKVMGVNEKIHPSTIARAYAILHTRKVLNMGGVIVIGGLSEPFEWYTRLDHGDFKEYQNQCILDEMSPYDSMIAATFEGKYLGCWCVNPEDFGVSIKEEQVAIENNRLALHVANTKALQGLDPALADYLALNAAWGLFAERYVGRYDDAILESGPNPKYVKECIRMCHGAITSGRAWENLNKYVYATSPLRGESLSIQLGF